MIGEHWPLYALRLGTPRLELRLPAPEDLAALAVVSAEPIHDPAVQPFVVAWTDVPPAERIRSTLQYFWRTQAGWRSEDWQLVFAVLVDGEVIGCQELSARGYPTLREVRTGSWLAQRFQGHGYGTEMRAAVLHLAFAGLGALAATSGAFLDNPASLRVSQKLGYRPDGFESHIVRGKAVLQQRLRLERAGWVGQQPVRIEGLDACRPMFGLPAG